MIKRICRTFVISAVVLLFLWSTGQAQELDPNTEAAVKLQKIIAGEQRTPAYAERDVYRRPLETLLWFGVRDDMTVVEIFPGGGWYSEILAPYLKENGTYYAAGYDAESKVRFFRRGAKQLKKKFAADPESYSKAVITELGPPNKTEIAPEGSADMVLTFRNVHNWMSAGTDLAVYEAMYKALKPGGVLGLIEHRGRADVPQDPKAKSGYVNEAYVIQQVEKVGFKLLGKSEINANPKDTKDYKKGVWTLPPTLRGKDKEKYLAIGESDRMTLKFVKP